MSVKAMAWAWEQDVSSTAKFVLLALADHADHEGVCWPGQKGIADKTGFGRQTVNKAIATLGELKLIEVKHRYDPEGRPQSNYYRLCMKEGGNVADDDRGSRLERQGIVADDDTNHPERTDQRTTDHVEVAPDEISVPEFLQSWNDICPPLGLAAVRELSSSRRAKVVLRIREHPKVAFWEDVFAGIKSSAFLLGRGPANGKAPWKVNFDWLIENDTNCIKIAEERYGNR